MKATLTFTLPEEREEFDHALRGSCAFSALCNVHNQIFRPARKHGYSNVIIQQIIDKVGDDAIDLIGLLEQEFWHILADEKINL
jgi:hypothetical protein